MTAKTEILLIEDDQAQAELMREMLLEAPRQQYRIQHVQYLAQGLELLKANNYDCVMVDLGLPDSQGLDSALSVRRQSRDVPIVILTVFDDEETAIRALRMDIQDYLVKGEINRAVLVRSLRYAIHRKAAADRLSESEGRLRYASEAANIGMWHWDLDKGALILSDKSKELFHLPTLSQPTYDEIMGNIHPEDRPRVDAAVREAQKGKEEYAEELRVVLPDGAMRWVLSKGRASCDDGGKPVRMDGINMDITQRKRAEEAAQRAKEEWERTFNSVPDLIAILDTEYRIARVNRALAAKVGKTPEECKGMPCYTFFHGTNKPPESCPHSKAVAEVRQQITEMQETGTEGYFLVSYTPLLDREGKPAGVVHVARDITERKRAEKRIEELNEELASRAADLEAANRELEAFNYTAAHDLHQPLNVIYGYCQAIEMLCGNELPGECSGFLQEIHQGIRRMTRLLDALLNFSRMSRVELRRTTVDLSATARGVAKGLTDMDPDHAAVFRIGEGIQADGDPALLEIVLQNLLGNAWKYAGEKDAVIEVGVTVREGKETYFVRDNGPGFDPAQADKLFAPFQRLPGSEAARGFGIGLATVQRIVERHGGRVWAEGEPGVGATFYFTLN